MLGILQSEALCGKSGDGGDPKKILVYFATCACVDYFYKVACLLMAPRYAK